MKIRVKWVEQVSFVAESGSGHAIVADGAPDAGGRNLGMRPMELLLAGGKVHAVHHCCPMAGVSHRNSVRRPSLGSKRMVTR